MKLKILLLLLIFTYFGCSDSQEQNTQSSSKIKATKKVEKPIKVTPSYDYSTLFKDDLPDCITVAELAEATGMDANLIKKKKKGKYDVYCSYELTLPDKSIMLYAYTGNPWKRQDVAREIKKYQEDKKKGELMLGMDIQTSETGDCYLLYQPLHGRLIIANANYDTAILSNYGGGVVTNGRISTFTKEQKLERKNMATKIANYLLKKHKK